MSSFRFICTLGAFALLAGCGESEEPDVNTAALQLTSDVLADTDVAGVNYTATQVDCDTGVPLVPAVIIAAFEELVDAFLPGGNGTFEDAPYDANSQHLFSDHFFWLPEGCYDVEVVPVDANGDPSTDCLPAHAENVAVVDGQTTEILLISQCEGDPAGGLDVITTINPPPQIIGLTYGPSKFACEGTIEVCVEVSDPDSDPLTAELIPQQPGVRPIATSQKETREGTTLFCATFEFEGPGTYNVTGVVYDMGWDENGDPVTIESLLAAQGDPSPSNDSITFPMHVLDPEACICACPDGFELNAAGDACERTVEEPAVFNGSLLEVCRGNTANVYGILGGQFPDGLIVPNAFFGDNTALNGRLNEVGIWACGPLGQLGGPSTQPVNEWVGFSRCLEVAAEGEYVVGIAADNDVRLTVDGTLVFEKVGANVNHFRYWWMVPISLTAGTHIIEMEGLNAGNIAAFGAELYGPYPAGSTANDAAMAGLDYANNILWSTGDQVGGNFHSGVNSGYACPDGLALNLCTDEFLCTGVLREECL